MMKKQRNRKRLDGELKMEQNFFEEVLKDLKKSNFVTTEQEILDSVENDTTGVFKEWLLTALEMHLYSGGKFIVDAETNQPLNSDFVRKILIKKIRKEEKMIKLNANDSLLLEGLAKEIEERGNRILSRYEGEIKIRSLEKGIEKLIKARDKNDPGFFSEDIIFMGESFYKRDNSGQLAVLAHELGHYVYKIDKRKYDEFLNLNGETEELLSDLIGFELGFANEILNDRKNYKNDKSFDEYMKNIVHIFYKYAQFVEEKHGVCNNLINAKAAIQSNIGSTK
jgi:hypothetical protein